MPKHIGFIGSMPQGDRRCIRYILYQSYRVKVLKRLQVEGLMFKNTVRMNETAGKRVRQRGGAEGDHPPCIYAKKASAGTISV